MWSSTNSRRSSQVRLRTMRLEPLELRCMLTSAAPSFGEGEASATSSLLDYEIQQIADVAISGNTGEKPQSKLWKHDNHWWSVVAENTGTWVWKLENLAWSRVLKLSTGKFRADVKSLGDVVHVLLERDTSSRLASLEFVAGQYQFWSVRPTLVPIALSSSTETATLDVDSTGRMWIASDAATEIEVRYSDAPYSTWSAPLVVAANVSTDDIASIIALPGGSTGVFWSNQATKRFGFRTHADGAPPSSWSADEAPGAAGALEIGDGLADDHINLAVASDGTLYAAVKTGYDTSSQPKIGLFIRSTSGVWSSLYEVDTAGTRPIVQLNEALGRILVTYRSSDTSGPIVFRESDAASIAFSPRQDFMPGTSLSNPSGSKQMFSGDLVMLGSSSGQMSSARLIYKNQPPLANAGADQTIVLSQIVTLQGAVIDDGLPAPPGAISVLWSKVSGPGTVTFADPTRRETTASFSATGTYLLRLTANDGETSGFDEVAISVTSPPTNQAPVVSAGPNLDVTISQAAGLDGSVTDDGIPNPPGAVTVVWSKVSGPGSVVFADAAAVDTTATFATTGTYVVRLTAHDGELSSVADATITVNAPVANQPPVVDAGPDLQTMLSQGAHLDGTVTDDGLPDPPGAVAISWSKLSGPGNVAFGSATEVDTSAEFDEAGSYVLRLTANDGAAIVTDDVLVEVTSSTAVTQSFQDGVWPSSTYSGTRDARIRSNYPNENYGSNSSILLNYSPGASGALKWDLSDIPANSILQSVSITVYVVNATVDTYELYALNKNWVEAEITWNVAANGLPWEVPGAEGASDRGATVLATFTSPAEGSLTFSLNADGVSAVQRWINDPGTNLGFLLRAGTLGNDSVLFRSRETGQAATRPQIDLTYVLASGSATSLSALLGGEVSSDPMFQSVQGSRGLLRSQVEINRDGPESPADVLSVIDHLNRLLHSPFEARSNFAGRPRLDVSSDGIISALHPLLITNEPSRNVDSGDGESARTVDGHTRHAAPLGSLESGTQSKPKQRPLLTQHEPLLHEELPQSLESILADIADDVHARLS